MDTVTSGEVAIDRCRTCGVAWFDFGEIRELTEGRLDADGEEDAAGAAPSPPDPGKTAARLAQARKEAAGLSCPRCSRALQAIDFQLTGTPVLLCRSCGGMLVPRPSVADLSARYRFQRDHAALYASLGASMAEEIRGRLDRKYGPDATAAAGRGEVVPLPLPLVVPLGDAAPAARRLPLVTYGILGLMLALHFLVSAGANGMGALPGRLALPAGTGFSSVPRFALLLSPFFHAGWIPLAVGCLFLYVLGDNVEDRMGRSPFLLFFLFCGAVAGAAHVLWGASGAPSALGSAGAVAAVLGAYLVFFPDVPIEMYGMGRVVTVPAYLFACAWAVAVFLWGWGPGPLSDLLNPAPYTLPGHLAGFAAGAGAAVLCRSFE